MSAAYASVKAHKPLDDSERHVDLFRDDLPTATIGINMGAIAPLAFAPCSDLKTGLALNLIDNVILLGFVPNTVTSYSVASWSSGWLWDLQNWRQTPG